MRRLAVLCLILPLACSRETPTPPAPATPAEVPSQTAPAVTQTSVPELQKGTYDEALLWFRSTPRFQFELREGTTQATGEMTRTTVGAEKVRMTLNGQEWLAETTAQGVAWKRREGGAWKAEQGPAEGGRLYQRVTVVFDPQKKENVPLLVSSEGDTNLYRFTDANTGAVHEVTVRKADQSIARTRIGDITELVIEP